MPVLLLLIGLGLRLGLAWQDHLILLSEFVWSDDAYISLSVARNLAHGHGMTSDGVNVTNGFQPLYVFLLVPVYLLVSPDNLVLPVHLAGTLLAVAGTASAGMFYLIALRLFSRTAALCVLFFFTMSHYFVATDVNGLETALYGLTLSGTLYYYLTRFGPPRSPSRGQCVILGVLAGLTALARVDGLIFLACVAVHFVWERRRAVGPALKQAATGSVAFLITLAPWLAANIVLCKTIVPASGPAVRFIAIHNGWRPVSNLVGYTGPGEFTDNDIPWQYYANNALRLTAQIIAFLPMTAHAQGFTTSFVFNKMERFPIGRLLARAPWVSLTVVAAVAVAVLVLPPLVKRRRLSMRSGLGDVAFVRFAVVGWIGAYGFYVLCPWYSHRYLYPALAMLTLASGAVLHAFLGLLPEKRRSLRRALLALGAVTYTFLFVTQTGHYYTAHRSPGLPDRHSPVIPWVKKHVPADATIACFQSGILSYFLPHRCVNLDGVVNAAALQAAREKRLWDYIRRENVDYIIDWPICIERNLKPFAGIDRLPLVTVYDEYTMDVFRIDEAP